MSDEKGATKPDWFEFPELPSGLANNTVDSHARIDLKDAKLLFTSLLGWFRGRWAGVASPGVVEGREKELQECRELISACERFEQAPELPNLPRQLGGDVLYQVRKEKERLRVTEAMLTTRLCHVEMYQSLVVAADQLPRKLDELAKFEEGQSRPPTLHIEVPRLVDVMPTPGVARDRDERGSSHLTTRTCL